MEFIIFVGRNVCWAYHILLTRNLTLFNLAFTFFFIINRDINLYITILIRFTFLVLATISSTLMRSTEIVRKAVSIRRIVLYWVVFGMVVLSFSSLLRLHKVILFWWTWVACLMLIRRMHHRWYLLWWSLRTNLFFTDWRVLIHAPVEMML
jgi:hypothetical protein